MTVQDTFTPLQNAVLHAIPNRRLTVVRAGPGSGKTRVFVEALRRELLGWSSPRSGVAALSFTNVAHEVISERLGQTPAHPHFVGTLDAFLLRFVVLPFAKLVGVHVGGARLIPEVVARMIEGPVAPFASGEAPIFQFKFVGGDEDVPQVEVRDGFGRKHNVDGNNRARLLKAKQADWSRTGRVTHSDCHYLASLVLRSDHGASAARLVAERFPVVLLDELQDTGWFLGRAMLPLLAASRRALVVGDADQAIFQFAGANGKIFDEVDRLSGHKSMVLDETHRCSRRVADVATELARSGTRVKVTSTAPEGRVLLLVYKAKAMEPAHAATLVRSHFALQPEVELVVLTRKASSVASTAQGEPWTSGTSAARICKAVVQLRQGDARLACQMLSSELSWLLLDKRTPTSEDLRDMDIDPRAWRRHVALFAMAVEKHSTGETWNHWIGRVRKQVELLAQQLGLGGVDVGGKLRRTNNGGDGLRSGHGVGLLGKLTSATSTVHAAKGREFANVVLLVSKPHATRAPCPSTVWWDAAKAEEMEVAYVACTRAKTTLCLAIHAQTYAALQKTRANFVSLFEVAHASDSTGRAEDVTPV